MAREGDSMWIMAINSSTFMSEEKILLIAETFCVVSLSRVVNMSECLSMYADSHKASPFIYLNTGNMRWLSVNEIPSHKKMRKPENCFWGQEGKKMLRENFNAHSWNEPIFFRWHFRTSRNKNWWERRSCLREFKDGFWGAIGNVSRDLKIEF